MIDVNNIPAPMNTPVECSKAIEEISDIALMLNCMITSSKQKKDWELA